jgi:hypothetical protein
LHRACGQTEFAQEGVDLRQPDAQPRVACEHAVRVALEVAEIHQPAFAAGSGVGGEHPVGHRLGPVAVVVAVEPERRVACLAAVRLKGAHEVVFPIDTGVVAQAAGEVHEPTHARVGDGAEGQGGQAAMRLAHDDDAAAVHVRLRGHVVECGHHVFGLDDAVGFHIAAAADIRAAGFGKPLPHRNGDHIATRDQRRSLLAVTGTRLECRLAARLPMIEHDEREGPVACRLVDGRLQLDGEDARRLGHLHDGLADARRRFACMRGRQEQRAANGCQGAAPRSRGVAVH